MKLLWRIAYRWNVVRARKARAAALRFDVRAEKFCARVKGLR